MRTVVAVIAGLVSSPVIAYLVAGLVCSIPGIKHSNACGHNAIYWLLLLIPLVFVFVAVGVHRFIPKQQRAS